METYKIKGYRPNKTTLILCLKGPQAKLRFSIDSLCVYSETGITTGRMSRARQFPPFDQKPLETPQ